MFSFHLFSFHKAFLNHFQQCHTQGKHSESFYYLDKQHSKSEELQVICGKKLCPLHIPLKADTFISCYQKTFSSQCPGIWDTSQLMDIYTPA